jgi:hypothetical protein
MNALTIFRTKPHSFEGCTPPSDKERLKGFRDQLQELPDYEPLLHAAQIAKGVTWLDEFKRRPIPKHRALVPVGKRRLRVQAIVTRTD